jgi:hypothetical protein
MARRAPRRRTRRRQTIHLMSTLAGANAAIQLSAPMAPAAQSLVTGQFQQAATQAQEGMAQAFSQETLTRAVVPALVVGGVRMATGFFGLRPGINVGRRRLSVLS